MPNKEAIYHYKLMPFMAVQAAMAQKTSPPGTCAENERTRGALFAPVPSEAQFRTLASSPGPVTSTPRARAGVVLVLAPVAPPPPLRLRNYKPRTCAAPTTNSLS